MIFKAIFLSLVTFTSLNASAKKPSFHGPHFPLEMTHQEYQKLWKDHQNSKQTHFKNKSELAPQTQMAIDGGEKFSRWLKKINENRPANDQIRLSAKLPGSGNGQGRSRGIPVDKPSKYGKKTIKTRLENILKELPESMKEIIYGDGELTDSLPEGIDKIAFIKSGRSVNYLYQTAVRWSTVIIPWMDWFKKRKSQDIRGFYHLRKIADLDEKLNSFQNLDDETKATYRKHLTDICINTQGSKNTKRCQNELNRSIVKNQVLKFKSKYWTRSQQIWNSFFNISNPRTDVTWNDKSPNQMSIPFAVIKDTKIAEWLKEHVEDEFKNKTWNMEVHFKKRKAGMAYLEFKPNVTPHVSGGNVIVMDANTSIEEPSVQWTIRHEFGHILRLPDCYIEFYDEEEEVAVNYQLDVTDLMCSRSGKFNQRIYDELKRVYFKK